MYALLVRFFDALERLLSTVSSGFRSGWRRLRDGPLQDLLFGLILLVTAISVVLRGIIEEADRLLAGVEKALISVAFLAMTVLSFSDYLRREFPWYTLEVQGGPIMAVVLMVWVGFLGASLATRDRKHLSVDASDRLLSPKAAKLVKRFIALVAAGFCWQFTGYSGELVSESVISGTGQEALPLWDPLIGPVNQLGALLLGDSGSRGLLLAGSGALLLASIAVLRKWRAADGDTPAALRIPVEVVGALALVVLGLGLLGTSWQPMGPDGALHEWVDLEDSATLIAEKAAATEGVNLDALVGMDTGAGGDDAAKAGNSTAELLASSSARQEFPQWLAQAVIPLSFILMAFRFLFQGLFGSFDPDPDLPQPKTRLEPTTGRGARDLIIAGLFPGVLIGLGAAVGLKTGWLILMGSLLLILTGAPLFLAIGVASVGCVTLIQDFSAANVAKDMFEAVKKEELLAIPFFVLAGNLMTHGSIAEKLVAVARAAMGRMPGGLGLATVAACVFFAAISGSSPVTVIAVGGIMFPMLVKERYPEPYSVGVLTSAGSLGIIIPPSVPMIIYAIMVSTRETPVSPNDLFIAGVLPGLLIAGALTIYTLYQTRPTRPGLEIVYEAPEGGYFKNLFSELRKSALALMLPVLILGGIYGVLGPLRFTVTEAAAVAVVYALVVELFVHRELKFKDLPKVLSESGVMMGSLFLIIVLAMAFNKFLSEQYIPQDAAAWLQAHVDSKWQFLLLANLFLLALGCVMEIVSAILIVAPLLAPIAASYGIDPIHFGIIFIVNLELGYLTPPMGINLFVSSTVFNRPVVDVMKATLPFLLLMLFCLAIIVIFPQLSLALL